MKKVAYTLLIGLLFLLSGSGLQAQNSFNPYDYSSGMTGSNRFSHTQAPIHPDREAFMSWLQTAGKTPSSQDLTESFKSFLQPGTTGKQATNRAKFQPAGGSLPAGPLNLKTKDLSITQEVRAGDDRNLIYENAYLWNAGLSQWTNLFKRVTENDKEGKILYQMISFWDDPSNQWVPFEKTEGTNNSRENIYIQVTWFWNKGTSQWKAYDKLEYVYDRQGNKISSTTFFPGTGQDQWIPYSKAVYTWDHKGNNTKVTGYGWNKTNNQWQASSIYVKTYDKKGNLILVETYDYFTSTGQWYYDQKTVYTYDARGNNIQVIEYFDWWTGTFTQNSKTENTFDQRNNLTSTALFYWYSPGQWQIYDKSEYIYNARGEIITEIHYTTNYSTVPLMIGSKTEYSYNPKGDLTSATLYLWDSQLSQYSLNEKIVYRYGDDDRDQDSQGGRDLTLKSAGTRAPVGTYDRVSGKINPNGAIRPGGSLNVYPNPAADVVTIDAASLGEGARITFYDVNGKQVLYQTLPGNRQVNVSGLPGGLYLYKVTDNQALYFGKLIVK